MAKTNGKSPNTSTLSDIGDNAEQIEDSEEAVTGLPEADESMVADSESDLNTDSELNPSVTGTTADLRTELAAAEHRALRTYADLDNYKKRFERELTRRLDMERERFLTVQIGIADNMRRALRVQDAESSPYRDGLLSVMRHIDSTLRDFGVEEISAEKGQPMDPNVHDAVMAIAVPGAEHESIVELVEPGYKMGDRVLRPAKVVVAKSEEPESSDTTDA